MLFFMLAKLTASDSEVKDECSKKWESDQEELCILQLGNIPKTENQKYYPTFTCIFIKLMI